MRLAAAIPSRKRERLTSDQGELPWSIGKARREGLFPGQLISVDAREFDLVLTSAFFGIQPRAGQVPAQLKVHLPAKGRR
jgi:hypothetical protein